MSHPDRIVVMMGGTRDVGFTVAHRLMLEKNICIAILDPDISAGERAITSLGTSCAMFIPTDPCNEESVRRALQAVVTRFGAIHTAIHFADQLCATAQVASVCSVQSEETAFRWRQTNQISAFNLASGCSAWMARNDANNLSQSGLMIFVMRDATSLCMLPTDTFEALGISVKTLFAPAEIATLPGVQATIADNCADLLKGYGNNDRIVSAGRR